ncbi:hypothetical protein T4D_10001 [Trichinella pseudospiralis]|uniref:Uncharacterized protein n=1 Tax=Trichinella pseudospiralis TaxID=6337 RepID=A0A0V1FIW4_TRIPS|nr:hypothetical protein T4D_10001 [Trichinella pseudospiralis]
MDGIASRLIFFLEVNKVTCLTIKRAALLSYCGGPVFKLIRTLISPANPSDKLIEDILFVLGEHFYFIADLHQLAQSYNFSETEIMLRDRLVVIGL